MNRLIIGGTSGLGLELAKAFLALGDDVFVMGRRDPNQSGLHFYELDLTAGDLPKSIEKYLSGLPHIDTVVYAAGFFQNGRVTDLSEDEIEHMLSVGGRGLIYAVRAVLARQNELSELITITSTSQWTPRQYEPIYNFVKSGGQLFSQAISLDGRVSKVLVAGPAGMRTRFWDGVDRDDNDQMLDPLWVAEQIMDARKQDYVYKEIHILRDPARVEEVAQT